MDENKVYWRRHEISIADYLMSHQDALREDFMRGFNTLEEACLAQTSPVMKPWRVKDRLDRGFSPEEVARSVTVNDQPNLTGWRATPFRYERHDYMNISFTASEEEMEKYPTARKLIEEYGDNCPIASYSVLAPNTVLQRHTGVENRSGEFIRIHIPLIIPEGDVFFEANGEEIDWSDLWAFHNQFAHSAHNNTNEWRLVFLLDIRRTFIGLEPGMPYDIKNESTYMKPFVRQKKSS
jgi:hypothetical protein